MEREREKLVMRMGDKLNVYYAFTRSHSYEEQLCNCFPCVFHVRAGSSIDEHFVSLVQVIYFGGVRWERGRGREGERERGREEEEEKGK